MEIKETRYGDGVNKINIVEVVDASAQTSHICRLLLNMWRLIIL